MTGDAAVPAVLLAVVVSLIELVKYLARRRANGNGTGPKCVNINALAGPLTRLEAGCAEGNRRLELILCELRTDRDEMRKDRLAAARADERAREFRRRMEQHMTDMECVRAPRTPTKG